MTQELNNFKKIQNIVRSKQKPKYFQDKPEIVLNKYLI